MAKSIGWDGRMITRYVAAAMASAQYEVGMDDWKRRVWATSLLVRIARSALPF